MITDLSAVCIGPHGSIQEAMACIDRNTTGIVLVVDENSSLIGTLTDGDIRRALLKGASLESPLAPNIQRDFTMVGPETGRAEVLDLMQARQLTQVPIVDSHGRLLGLHLLREIIGAVERSNWAVVMAGGKGTRLHPITEHLPKSMIKVAGRPILERLLLHLVGFGIKRVFFAIHYMGHIIEEHFGDGARFGCRIEYLRETEALGTGGALALLPEKPMDPLMILNGDLVTQVNLESMLAFHTNGRYFATMAVRRYSHQIPFGCLKLDGNRIYRFEEKPVLERFINAGIYVLSPGAAARVPRRFFPITDLFEECIERGEAVGAFEIQEDWMDIGQREQLKKAQQGTS